MEVKFKILEVMRNLLIANANNPLNQYDVFGIEQADIENNLHNEEDLHLWLKVLTIQGEIFKNNTKYYLTAKGIIRGLKIESLSNFLANLVAIPHNAQFNLYKIEVNSQNLSGIYSLIFRSQNLPDLNNKLIEAKGNIISELGLFRSYYLIENEGKPSESRFATHFLPESHTLGSDLYIHLADSNYVEHCIRSEGNYRTRLS